MPRGPGHSSEFRFFLSYSRADASHAGKQTIERFYRDLAHEVRVAAGLPKRGAVGFKDDASIPLGSRWKSRIPRALDQSRCVVALYSPNFFKSKYCEYEVLYFLQRLRAYQRQSPYLMEPPPLVLPVVWEPATDIPESFAAYQWANGRFPTRYEEDGLRTLSRLQKERDSYISSVKVIAGTIVNHTEEFRLGPEHIAEEHGRLADIDARPRGSLPDRGAQREPRRRPGNASPHVVVNTPQSFSAGSDGAHVQSSGFPDFGNPTAINDFARVVGQDTDLFVHARSVDDYLSREPTPVAVVGAKGTGKSLALFFKARESREKPSVLSLPVGGRIAFAPSSNFAALVEVVPFWQLQTDKSGEPDVVKWTALWEWALLKTVVESWEIHSRPGADDPRAWPDPFEILRSELQLIESGQRRTKGAFQLPDPRKLQVKVSQFGNRYPPTALFVDNQDDFFEDNPEFWLGSSMGLFLAARNVLEHTNHRVRVHMTLRPEVLTHLRRREGFPMWTADFFHLHWRDQELIQVFAKRAAVLNERHLRSPHLRDRDPIAAFFGIDLTMRGPDAERESEPQIRNVVLERSGDSQVYEGVSAYLLRHTLRRPRDLIIVGNELVDSLKLFDEEHDTIPYCVREAVERAAGIIGQSYLVEVQRHWPWAGDKKLSIEAFIRHLIPKNVLTPGEADEVRVQFLKRTGGADLRPDPFSVLFSVGLLGYPRKSGRQRGLIQSFVSPGQGVHNELPNTVGALLLHPVLYGERFGLELMPGLRVGPSLPFPSSAMA